MIGARTADASELPFLVGWNGDGQEHKMHCSGSLISPSFILIASHCNNYFKSEIDRKKKMERCLQTTKKGKGTIVFMWETEIEIKCKWIMDESDKKAKLAFEVMAEPKGQVWIGINDTTGDMEYKRNYMRRIKRHIIHSEPYVGGGYNDYGGYDIALLELDTPYNGNKVACLPSPTFDDIRLDQKDSIIAGYGNYRRDVCETNNFGMMKFHYCDRKFGDGNLACNTDKPPPMPSECETFFNDPNTPNTVPAEVEEIKLEGVNASHPIFCYPKENPQNASFGWCLTEGNYFDRNNPDTMFQDGWGFCGKDCYLDTEVINKGILREKHKVEILSEDICDNMLDEHL